MTKLPNVLVQVPIKTNSERIPGKNFKDYQGKPLFRHLLDRLADELPHNYQLLIDVDSEDTKELMEGLYGWTAAVVKRPEWFASNAANGNHLLSRIAHISPGYDIYVQTFVTAPHLQTDTITELVDQLCQSECNSATLFTEECGWFWKEDMPVNYNYQAPNGLPRSQDAMVLKETTGVYAVKRDALFAYSCRLVDPVLKVIVSQEQAKDIDRPEDMK